MLYLFRSFRVAVAIAFAAGSADPADAWAELAKSGAIVLLRHATVPGFGDPPGSKREVYQPSATWVTREGMKHAG